MDYLLVMEYFLTMSPLRGETFVTRKITRAVASIKKGLQDKLWLGNLNAKETGGMRKIT